MLSREEGAGCSRLQLLIIGLLMAAIALGAWLGDGLRRAWGRVRFWLTVTKVCSWCDTVTHRAHFGRKLEITHGICDACLSKELRKLQTKEAQ